MKKITEHELAAAKAREFTQKLVEVIPPMQAAAILFGCAIGIVTATHGGKIAVRYLEKMVAELKPLLKK